MVNNNFENLLLAWENNLEQHWGFTQGAFRQTGIIRVLSDVNNAVVTKNGIMISCQDQQVASAVVAAIQEHSEKEWYDLPHALQQSLASFLPDISIRIDLSLCCWNTSCAQTIPLQERVEILPPKTEGLPELPDNVEHVFAIREGETILSWASNIPQVQVNGSWLHSVGVGTHPDYRRKGFAKAVVSVLIQHVVSESGMALWVCDATNIASLKLARSVGFQEHFWVLHWS